MDRLSSRAVVAALIVLSASRAQAQQKYLLSPFASINRSLDGSPLLMGAELTSYGSRLGGILGMRFSGAYDMRALTSSGTSTTSERGWAGDVDGVISPSRLPVIGPLLGGFIPTVFAGFGVEGLRRADGTGGQGFVTSYGAGVTRTIGNVLSFDTEARRRTPVGVGGSSGPNETPIVRQGWEYRIGLSIGFGGKPAPRGIPGITVPRASRVSITELPATTSAAAVISTADGFLGTRYSYGGSSPQTGFDCSGFVQYVYRQNGLTLPRTSRQQATAGQSLPTKLENLRAGDLLFFSQKGDVVDHVAIYAGNDRILHSSSSGGGVRYDDLMTARGQWFRNRLVAVRRVFGDGQPFVAPNVAQLDQKLDPPDAAPKP
jgi:cell wall-associated NlpC family hydrolase